MIRDNKELLIIIPCLNEEKSIKGLIKELKEIKLNADILVIDDGSTDKTYLKATEQTTTIKLIKNIGIGGAVQTGIKYAKYFNYKYCLQIDGDGQHNPKEIIFLVEKQKKTNSSITIGSRYLRKGSFKSTLARKSGTFIIAKLLNFLYSKSNTTDPTSGMRLLDQKSIDLFASNYPSDYPEPISIGWALKKGFIVSEVPVKMRLRKHGTSSIIGFSTVGYMVKVLLYILVDYYFNSVKKNDS